MEVDEEGHPFSGLLLDPLCLCLCLIDISNTPTHPSSGLLLDPVGDPTKELDNLDLAAARSLR